MNTDHITGEWLASLRWRNLSPKTIQRRAMVLRRFIEWCDPLTADRHDVEAWLTSLAVSPQSRSYYLSDLGSFYTWAVRNEVLVRSPAAQVERPLLPDYEARPIPTDELAHAVDQADQTMRAILSIAALAGLRRSEIARLDATDVNLSDRTLRVRQGKGKKDRTVPLSPALSTELQAGGNLHRGPVILSTLGRAYKPDSLGQKANEHLAGCGSQSTIHCLRHWFATQMLEETGDVVVVQKLMGHANTNTTAKYTAVSARKARAAVECIEPPWMVSSQLRLF